MATLPTIVLVLLFTTGAARPVLTSNGYDKVRFGMRLTAAEVLLGEKSVAAGESGVETCRYVSFASLPHVRFMVESADWLCEKHFGKSLIDRAVVIRRVPFGADMIRSLVRYLER